MTRGRLNSRFFESTRGRIVHALRLDGKTVNELADGLELTDNAVRAHLTQQDLLCKVNSRTPAPEDAYAAITFTLWTTD